MLTKIQFIEGAHWVHLENSEPVNEAIIDWLRRLTSERDKHFERQSDEL